MTGPLFVIGLSEALGLVVLAIILALLGVPLLISALRRVARQKLCKHNQGVRETQSCRAVCLACGKTLGFIGDWRGRDETPQR